MTVATAHAATSAIGGVMPAVTLLLCVIAGAAASASRVVASQSAAARAMIWRAALLAAIVLPLAALLGPRLTVRFNGSPASTDAARFAQRTLGALGALDPASVSAASATRAHAYDLPALLGSLWLAGFLVAAVRTTRQLLFAARIRRRALPVSDAFAQRSALRACRTVHYDGAVSVLVSLEIDVPLVLGAFRPCVIVPAASSEWSAHEWDVVLLHETAHLARRDLVARALGMIAGLAHWFNPVVPWLRRQLERDAELAADEAVLRAGVAPLQYADVLLAMAERASWHAAPAMSLTLARTNGLERRIGELLRETPLRPVLRRSTELTVTLFFAFAAFSAACMRPKVQTTAPAFALLQMEQSGIVSSPAIRPGEAAAPRRRVRPPLRASANVSSDWRDGARAALVALLDDPSPQVRAAAARSLERYRGGASNP